MIQKVLRLNIDPIRWFLVLLLNTGSMTDWRADWLTDGSTTLPQCGTSQRHGTKTINGEL